MKAVIEMSSKIQPASPEEYVPMVKVREYTHTQSDVLVIGCVANLCRSCLQEVGLALRMLLATVDETIPILPPSTHREVSNSHQAKSALNLSIMRFLKL